MAKKSDLNVILKPFPPEKLFPTYRRSSDWKLSSDVQIRVNLENIKIEPNENKHQHSQQDTENLDGAALVGVEILPVPTVLDPSELFAQYHKIVTDYESNCTVCHQLIHLLAQHIQETHKESRSENGESPEHLSKSKNGINCQNTEEVQNMTSNCSTEDIQIPESFQNSETTIAEVEKDSESATMTNTKSQDETLSVYNEKVQKSPRRRTCKSKYRNIHVHEAGAKCPKCPSKFPSNIKLNGHSKKQTPEQSKATPMEGIDSGSEIDNTDKPKIAKKQNPQDNGMKINGKSRKTKKFLCKVCNFTFTTQSRFKTHVKQKHSSGVSKTMSFSCHICSKSYPALWKLYRHYGRHHKGMPKKCTLCKYCDLTFFNFRERDAHTREDHPTERLVVCKICNKILRCKAELEYHERRSHSTAGKQFKCTEHGCEKSYFSQSELNAHMKIHKGRMYNYKCQADGCTRSFCTATELKTHTMRHTGEKPFMCEVCGKSFTVKMSLKAHLVVHQEENGVRIKPWVCDCCDARFALKGQLTLHYLKHTGERRHLCQECGKRFILPSHLKTHLKTHLKG